MAKTKYLSTEKTDINAAYIVERHQKKKKRLALQKNNGSQKKAEVQKGKERGEQDGRGVGGRGVHLSPLIHQEYTIRHRSASRTPAESGQEYLTSRKEYMLLLLLLSRFSRVRLCATP